MSTASNASASPRRNLELKARLASLDGARAVARKLATDYLGIQLQTDTYFHCDHGRLKLRQIKDQPDVLIAYARPDEPGSKVSEYHLVPIADAGALWKCLASALGVLNVVEKRREIFLYDNVRIHLDEVVGLGTFLEFEAVILDDAAAQRAPQQIAMLRERFGICDDDLVAVSYSDMPS